MLFVFSWVYIVIFSFLYQFTSFNLLFLLLCFNLIIFIFNGVTAWAQQGFVRCCSMTVMTRWVVELIEPGLAVRWYRRGPEFHLGIWNGGYHWKWHKTSCNEKPASRLCIWANQVTAVAAEYRQDSQLKETKCDCRSRQKGQNSRAQKIFVHVQYK